MNQRFDKVNRGTVVEIRVLTARGHPLPGAPFLLRSHLVLPVPYTASELFSGLAPLFSNLGMKYSGLTR